MQSELCSTVCHTLNDAESVLFKSNHAVGGNWCSQSCALLFATRRESAIDSSRNTLWVATDAAYYFVCNVCSQVV